MEEEDYIFKPEELLFAIAGPDEEGISMVCLTPKAFWKDERHVADDIGSHNTPGDILTKCGVFPDELMESVFEIMEGFTAEQVKTLLLEAGFGQDEEFSKFITDGE